MVYDVTGDSLPFSHLIVAGKAEIAISELSRVFRNTSTGGARSAFSIIHLAVATRYVLPSNGDSESCWFIFS